MKDSLHHSISREIKEKNMYGELTVLDSAAGYYIGRVYTDDEGFVEPGTRESDYYPTKLAAILAVVDGFYLRECSENVTAYEADEIDTPPGSWYQDCYFWEQFI
jgi:hypothetical protein